VKKSLRQPPMINDGRRPAVTKSRCCNGDDRSATPLARDDSSREQAWSNADSEGESFEGGRFT
jgi:hypothetical protein